MIVLFQESSVSFELFVLRLDWKKCLPERGSESDKKIKREREKGRKREKEKQKKEM